MVMTELCVYVFTYRVSTLMAEVMEWWRCKWACNERQR